MQRDINFTTSYNYDRWKGYFSLLQNYKKTSALHTDKTDVKKQLTLNFL